MACHKHNFGFPSTVADARPTSVEPFELSNDSDGGIILVADKDGHVTQGWSDDDAKVKAVNYKPGLEAKSLRQGLNWCDRGFHVDFGADEYVPLHRGRLLGHGAQGGVYETTCKGVSLAWKTKYCRKRKIQDDQRREIDILKKLSHHHVVKVVGTYTQGAELGLLIWPVALCDLATFMDDIDAVHASLTVRNICDADRTQLSLATKRFHCLCPDTKREADAYDSAISRLSACFGCLSSALGYVHGQRIRHKDIKPHNILISRNGVWLADFGISSDFSALSNSQSEAIERGTMKYFAPEVADYDRSGRAADIFSLGCIFLEMSALINGVSLEILKRHRPEERGSYQENLQHRQSWFQLLRTGDAQSQHILCEIQNMIEAEPRLRPSAKTLNKHLKIISQLGKARSLPLHGPCCANEQFEAKLTYLEAENANLKSDLREREQYIDTLLALRSPTESKHDSLLPRPPMGSNLGTMASPTCHSDSCD